MTRSPPPSRAPPLSQVLMFVCVRADHTSTSETLCSLEFASRAKAIDLGKAKRNVTSVADAVLADPSSGAEKAENGAGSDATAPAAAPAGRSPRPSAATPRASAAADAPADAKARPGSTADRLKAARAPTARAPPRATAGGAPLSRR